MAAVIAAALLHKRENKMFLCKLCCKEHSRNYNCMVGIKESDPLPKTKNELADFWQLSEDERHPEE